MTWTTCSFKERLEGRAEDWARPLIRSGPGGKYLGHQGPVLRRTQCQLWGREAYTPGLKVLKWSLDLEGSFDRQAQWHQGWAISP